MKKSSFGEWIKKDLKEPLLKEIQGHIWEERFLKGELKGHVYEDAYICLKNWKERGYKIYVYSSNSEAFLWTHRVWGYYKLVHSFFDTSVGRKKEKDSYTKIAQLVEFPPKSFLFLSDAVLVSRNGFPIESKHITVKSFFEVKLLLS